MITDERGFKKVEEQDYFSVAVSDPDSAFNSNVDLVGTLLDEMNANMDGKAMKPTTVFVTLTATGWVGGAAPYEQAIAVAGVTAEGTTDQFVDVADDVTLPQLEAYSAAQITGYTQSVGSVTLRAWGEKPNIDIPLKVQVVRL